MSENKNDCPFVKFDHPFYPDNTCVLQWNYCNNIGSYVNCDLHKRHTRIVDVIINNMREQYSEKEN